MKNILVAIDFSKNTLEVTQQASTLAKELGGKLWFIHVSPNEQLKNIAYESTQFYDFAPEFISAPVGDIELARDLCAAEYKREHQALLHLSDKMRKEGVDSQAILLKGDVAETILEKADSLGIDMIVMGSHGHRAIRRLLTGSITEAVLRHAKCGVFIIPSLLQQDLHSRPALKTCTQDLTQTAKRLNSPCYFKNKNDEPTHALRPKN